MTTRDLLARLISFNTISRNPNRELMDFVARWLQEHGIATRLIPNDDGSKANLYATVGPTPTDAGLARGILLSGHTDVVPVEGQDWTRPAFTLSEDNGRYYGRGTADMKGFVACALTAMVKAKTMSLATPLHLALSYDEEIGCVGVRSLIEHMANQTIQPCLCLVGEPTDMMVAIRHKGKIAARATFTGRESHSALAPQALNAIHLACDFVTYLQTLQQQLAAPFLPCDASDIPYTTVHAGLIAGGTALNIVPNQCTVDFEIRNASDDDPKQLLRTIMDATHLAVSSHQSRIPEACASFQVFNEYPGLDTPEDSWAVDFIKSLTGANGCTEVAFGTEAGLFNSQLKIPSVVCGPGSMAQGHKPDEYISIDQMNQCERMLDKLLTRLCQSSPGTP